MDIAGIRQGQVPKTEALECPEAQTVKAPNSQLSCIFEPQGLNLYTPHQNHEAILLRGRAVDSLLSN